MVIYALTIFRAGPFNLRVFKIQQPIIKIYRYVFAMAQTTSNFFELNEHKHDEPKVRLRLSILHFSFILSNIYFHFIRYFVVSWACGMYFFFHSIFL